MCGIAGFVTKGSDEKFKNGLKNAVAALKHRGPDGAGYHFSDGVGLGHARLAIIDLVTGDQPLYNEDQTLVTVINGEFYNYGEISAEISADHRFRTKSDSEVLLHLYEDLPIEKALNKLNGMWAAALWDSFNKRLILTRDRAGKKPLYYALIPDAIVFGSEIKALLAFDGVSREPDETALALYLKYGYVPAPYSIYKHIKKLPPAGYAVYENGNFSVHSYWRPPRDIIHGRRFEEWREELSALFDDAVRLRLISDVPLGVFLSGGLDSSLIASYVTDHASERVKSFCIGFEDPSYDESSFSKEAAARLDTDHHLEVVKFDSVDQLPEYAAHFDEPFADPSFLPTWHLARVTRQKVTVALSGDAGDELFGGYRRYMAGKLSGMYSAIPGALRKGVIEPVVDRLPVPDKYYGKSTTKKAKLFVEAANRYENDPAAVAPRLFSDQEIRRLFPGLALPGPGLDPVLDSADPSRKDHLDKMSRCDFLTYLADDILVKVDRMSMYHALEVRCPFLDYRIVELAHRMPSKFKINGLTTKYILRKLAETRLPGSILNRSKQGFMVPLDIWFRNELRDSTRDMITDASAPWSIDEGKRIFNEHQAGRHDHATKLWALAVLAGWKAGSDQNG